jgi:hypothetical protein
VTRQTFRISLAFAFILSAGFASTASAQATSHYHTALNCVFDIGGTGAASSLRYDGSGNVGNENGSTPITVLCPIPNLISEEDVEVTVLVYDADEDSGAEKDVGCRLVGREFGTGFAVLATTSWEYTGCSEFSPQSCVSGSDGQTFTMSMASDPSTNAGMWHIQCEIPDWVDDASQGLHLLRGYRVTEVE